MGSLAQSFTAFVAEQVIGIEEGLESERVQSYGRVGSLLAKGWDFFATPVRDVPLPEDIFVVGVGGTTLGGSCKTSVAIAIAKHLSSTGEGTYVAHSNRPEHDEVRLAESKLGDATKVVHGKDWQERFRSLEGGPSEQRQSSRWAVADGLLQSRPIRLGVSVLAVDAYAPLGKDLPPPLGNRRYALESLLDACDIVVSVEDLGDESSTNESHAFHEKCAARNVKVVRATRTLTFENVDLNVLRRMRLGLATHLARPVRLRQSLEKLGIFPVGHWRGSDHGRIFGMSSSTRVGKMARGGAFDPTVEGWVCSEKCRYSLGESLSPLFVARESIEFSADFVRFLSARRRQEHPPGTIQC